jgi:hypothetical protein
MIIVFGHFVVPFMLLLPRAVKRNLTLLKIIAIWIVIVHWIDLYWVIQPSFSPRGATFSWMDLAGLLGIGGIFLWSFMRRYASHALVPVNDPRLDISIKMKN